MQHKWLGIVGSVILLTACNSNIEAKSDVVSQNKIDEIINTVNNLYPDTEQSLKQKIVNVAVKSIENMVFIEGGSFMMGDFLMPCENEDLNRPVWTPDSTCLSDFFSVKNGSSYLHKVILDSYSLSKFETEMLDLDIYFQTLGLPFVQWKDDGKYLKRTPDELEYFEKKPAKTREWQEAKDYCQWIGKITSLPFDLPTEAQWEYAARSRGKNLYYATNNGFLQYEDGQFYDKKIGFYRDFKKDEVNIGKALSTKNVGRFPPNPLGLYDMTGNAGEWVNDWFSENYYKISPEKNPHGPDNGTKKVMRMNKTMARVGDNPVQSNYSYRHGFRCSVNSQKNLIRGRHKQ